MKNFTLLISVLFLLAVCSCGEYPELPTRDAEEETWHDRFVADSCSRCPQCCVQTDPEGNVAAYLDDGSVCLEENHDLVKGSFTEADLRDYCYGGKLLPESF